VDERRGETLGTLRVNLSDLLAKPSSLAIPRQEYNLRTRRGARNSPQITLGLALRFIHRPATVGYGTHRSLQVRHRRIIPRAHSGQRAQELARIMHKTTDVLEVPQVTAETPKKDISSVPLLPQTLQPNFVAPPKPARPSASGAKAKPKELPLDLVNNNKHDFPYIDDTASESSTLERSRVTINDTSIVTAMPVTPLGNGGSQVTIAVNSPSSPSSVEADPSPPLRTVQVLLAQGRLLNGLFSSKVFDRGPRVLLSLKYDVRSKGLAVVVHKVKNLQETTLAPSPPSPYVKVYELESAGAPGSNRRMTNTKRKTKMQKNKVKEILCSIIG